MKILSIIIIFSLAFSISASASEIFGDISTGPNVNKVNDQGTNTISSTEKSKTTNGSIPLYLLNSTAKSKALSGKEEKENVKVLGIIHYPDNSLLRNSRKQIFVVNSKIKKHILDLNELKGYKGPIYNVGDSVLDDYVEGYFPGDLIRQKNQVKIYVLKSNKRKYIPNLDELRKKYFGKIIYNISPGEMAVYE